MSKKWPKENYYTDEVTDDFMQMENLKTIHIPDNYRYVSKNPFFKALAWFLRYFIAWPLLNIGCRIFQGVKVKNRQVLKKVKHQGFFIYANHVVPTDCTYNNAILTIRRVHTIVHPNAVSIKGIKTIVKMLGALPLGTSNKSNLALNAAVKHYIEKKHQAILIYPEAHIWPYCTWIRRFSPLTTIYPVRLNAPVIVATTTFRKAKFPFKKPRITVYLDGPLFPSQEHFTKNEMNDLADRIHSIMSERAKNSIDTGYHYYKKES
ncbi:MAG: hypothetical protein LBR37_00570 [Erysipelotrichaceae bacterium]|jgi:1-acyl-sn-glycerol-3-phosphate acyltransferase|nr:hypothetical protein [Erysipelotrichaceae bacterium]